jgi:N-acetylgalactosamine kinase
MRRTCKNIDRAFFISHPVLKKHISLLESLQKTYHSDDDVWFIKAPGRVNLIGEHTDYNMGPVLPCAIDREIVFCLRGNNSAEICISNVDPKFERIRFSFDRPFEAYSKGHWGNYIKAGVKGILDYFDRSDSLGSNEIKGYDAIVSSTLPLAAGLSSSSALVVAAAFSLLVVNQITLDKLKLAEICAEAEHFVGTAGGGMDQTTSLMGKKNTFLRIEFNPFKVQSIPAPKNIALLLFHSLVEAEKSHHVREEYNRRVLECRIGVDLYNRFIAKHHNDKVKPIRYIGEIQSDYYRLSPPDLDMLVLKFLNQLKDSYKKEEIAAILEISHEKLDQKYSTIINNNVLIEPANGFKIKGRFRHVYSECQRVDRMIQCLLENDIVAMSDILKRSHDSLSKDYEVSTPEVDSLLKTLRGIGITGARLMGAGFGGMILALTDRSKRDKIIEKMKETFYSQKIPEVIDNYIIPCVTSDGAGEI